MKGGLFLAVFVSLHGANATMMTVEKGVDMLNEVFGDTDRGFWVLRLFTGINPITLNAYSDIEEDAEQFVSEEIDSAQNECYRAKLIDHYFHMKEMRNVAVQLRCVPPDDLVTTLSCLMASYFAAEFMPDDFFLEQEERLHKQLGGAVFCTTGYTREPVTAKSIVSYFRKGEVFQCVDQQKLLSDRIALYKSTLLSLILLMGQTVTDRMAKDLYIELFNILNACGPNAVAQCFVCCTPNAGDAFTVGHVDAGYYHINLAYYHSLVYPKIGQASSGGTVAVMAAEGPMETTDDTVMVSGSPVLGSSNSIMMISEDPAPAPDSDDATIVDEDSVPDNSDAVVAAGNPVPLPISRSRRNRLRCSVS